MDIERLFFTSGRLRPVENHPPPSTQSRRVTANVKVPVVRRDVAGPADGNVTGGVSFYVDFDDVPMPTALDPEAELWSLEVAISSEERVTFLAHGQHISVLDHREYPQHWQTTGRVVLGEAGMIEVDLPEDFATVSEGTITAPSTVLRNVRAFSAWPAARTSDGSVDLGSGSVDPGNIEIPAPEDVSDLAPDGGAGDGVDVDLQDCLRAAERPDRTTPDQQDVGGPGASDSGSGAGAGTIGAQAPPTTPLRRARSTAPGATAKARKCIRRAKRLRNRKARARALRRCRRASSSLVDGDVVLGHSGPVA
jgi:hypothetical protein